MKRSQVKKLILTSLLVFFFVLMLVSGYFIYDILSEYAAEEEASDDLQQFIHLDETQPPVIATEPPKMEVEAEEETEGAMEETEPAPTEDPYPYPVVDFDALLETNEDVVGWIYIEGTKINYPIVQTVNNSYYVERMVNGQRNAAGSIFMDYRNESNFTDRNSILYGHNMKNGSMFAGILDYRKPSFFEEHPEVIILTPERNFRYEVVAGYVCSPLENAWRLSFATDAEFANWLTEALNRSVIGGSFEASGTDQILTLSTCTYEFQDARFVLVCRLI